MAELTVENLHLRYGDNPILKGVSLVLDRGQVVSLLGPSGSGKTTLLRAVAGLEAPHQGTIRIGDKIVFDSAAGTDIPAEGRNLGLVFQSYALWPHKTVLQNVGYALRLRRVPGAEIATRVKKALEQLSLAHLAERYPHQLSGGQQQRVALARALVYNPPVILLDEPLSNLDAKLREEARAWLRELIVTMQLSALCVTHDQAEALAMSDRILLLNEGRIEQEGTPQQMYSNPSTLFTADFMGSNNRLTGRIAELRNGVALLEGEGWRLWGDARPGVAAGREGVGMIRLERVRVADGPGDNRVQAELTTSMYLGDKWEHLFHLGAARIRAYGDRPLAEGRHWLDLPPRELWVF
ncbi:MAG TPA: ABC transporter ATP-binding protein [Casimicrobiaceae bacterium]|jgi:iron(III) transport system ATP-binding protein|nr:ABC transporter ATP-binding protein [Casimicrobiaceae bacterium]